ncbi:MAG: hypothetical protein WCE21_02370 [Candidatus Babeliales bacterium]
MNKLLLSIVVSCISIATMHAMEDHPKSAPIHVSVFVRHTSIIDLMVLGSDSMALDPEIQACFKEHHKKYQDAIRQIPATSFRFRSQEGKKQWNEELFCSVKEEDSSSEEEDSQPMTIGQFHEQMTLFEKDEKLRDLFE